ncbi:MAG: type II toxin-antitoxin system RelE/ParE family toxin [Deltaproteobacteria bacterium]|nr:type II toxin-antitoxin system RelE/ParE family toxin [Deltaproteobacteria bacterium]
MLFVETPIFTRELPHLMSDDDYRALQSALLLRPGAGPIVPGGGGLRKVRWGLAGKGKRGALRVIYYWNRAEECIYMLLVYRKSRQEDLTQEQLRILRRLVKENLK